MSKNSIALLCDDAITMPRKSIASSTSFNSTIPSCHCTKSYHCFIVIAPSRHRPNHDGAILNFVVLSELGIPATSSFITYITSAFKLMVRLRWRDTAMMMPLETIVSTVVFQLSSTNSIFAIVPTQHRTTSSSHHRYCTIAPLLHRHHTSIIEFSRHRSIDPNLDGAIVNYIALSGFHK